MKKELLGDYLKSNHMGREKAISGERLCSFMRVRSSDLLRYVNRLRQEGVPICCCPGGYFYGQNAGEVIRSAQSLEKKIAGMNRALKGMYGSLTTFCRSED